MEAAGWTVDWVAAGLGSLEPPTDDDVIQLRRTITVDSLASDANPIRPTAIGLLDGLAETVALSSTGTLAGSLTVELVIGGDTSGFYVDPSSAVTLDIDGSVAVDGDAAIAGGAGDDRRHRRRRRDRNSVAGRQRAGSSGCGRSAP